MICGTTMQSVLVQTRKITFSKPQLKQVLRKAEKMLLVVLEVESHKEKLDLLGRISQRTCSSNPECNPATSQKTTLVRKAREGNLI